MNNDSSQIDRSSNLAEDRFQQFFDRHEDNLSKFLCQKKVQTADIDDIIQEVWIKARRKFDENQKYHGGWLRKIAQNALVDIYRKRKVRRESSGLTTDPVAATPEPDEENPSIKHLKDCESQLPDHERAVVELRFHHGQSTNQIAETLGINSNMVYQRVCRAMKQLRECVKRKQS